MKVNELKTEKAAAARPPLGGRKRDDGCLCGGGFLSVRPAPAHLGTDVLKRGRTHEREADEENILMGETKNAR